MSTFFPSSSLARPLPATRLLLPQGGLLHSASRLPHAAQPVQQNILFSGKNASPIEQLVTAAGNGDKGTVSVLLAQGVEPSMLDAYGNSPLSSAAENGHLDIVRQFIPLVDINQRNQDGFTALIKAASSNHPEVVRTLLEAGANPNIPTYDPRNTALHNASAKGYTSVVRILLNHQGKIETDINARNKEGLTALNRAALANEPQVVQMLLEAGADPNIPTYNYKNTALHNASAKGYTSVVRILSNHQGKIKTKINADNHDGLTALHLAAASNQPQVVKMLLDAGADPNVPTYDDRNTALHSAAYKGYAPVVQMLVDHQGRIKTRLNAENEEGLTALNRAALANHPQVVKILLDAGADPNIPTYDARNTALHNAAGQGHASVVKVLVDHQGRIKTKIDADNHDGLTALHLAAASNQPQVVKMLLDAGADPNVPTYDDRNTALHSAAYKGYTPVVQVLIEHAGKIKTNIDARNIDGFTALNRASLNGHLGVVDLLLKKRAGCDIPDNKDHSPLANAVYYNHLPVVKRLLAADADPNARNKRHQTPLSRARELKRNNLIPYLENPLRAKQEYEAQAAELEAQAAKAKEGSPVSEPAPQVAKKAEKPVFRTNLDTAIVRGASDEELDLLILNTNNIDRQNADGFTPLLLAAMYGRASALRKLLAAGAQRDLPNNSGDTPLAKAALRGDLVSTQILLDAGANIDKANKHGDTPLINAAKIGALPVVDLLIARGAKLDEKDESGFTALNHAVSECHPEIVKRLLKGEADPTIVSREGFTPLNTAASKGFEEIVDMLLEAKKTLPTEKKAKDYIDIPNKYGDTALLNAISKKHRNIARKLLAAGANPDHKNGHDDTPLGKALHANDAIMARLLIQYEANPNSKNKQGNTPLISAALTGNEEIVDLLLASGAEGTIDHPNEKGFTALHSAAFKGFEGIVAKLLLWGANADIPNKSGFTPLNSAVCNGRYEVARLLLQHGVNIDKGNNQGRTPLSNAIFRKNRPMVELLNSYKADPKLSSKEGFSLLHTAVESGSTDMVESAAKAPGANINVRDKGGNTPLINAAFKGRIDIVRQLLAMEGIQANCTNLGGYTALGVAVKNSHFDVAKLLLDHGVNPDIPNTSGDTPIMQATYQGNDKMVALLLKHQANPDIPNLKGHTPLTTASGRGFVPIVKILLATRKVNIDHSTDGHATALARALMGGHEDIAKLLLDAGASPHAPSGSGGSSVGIASRLGLSKMTQALIGAKPGVNEALLRAVEHGELPVIRRLLKEEQADINTVDAYENTPLHLAVETKDPKIVEEVLEHKPDLSKLNSAGDSAVTKALLQGQSDIIDLLQQYANTQSFIQKRQSEIARGLPSFPLPSRKRQLDTEDSRQASSSRVERPQKRKLTEAEIKAQIREQYEPKDGGWIKKYPPHQGIWIPNLPSLRDEDPFKISRDNKKV